jgi:hypothetical protein
MSTFGMNVARQADHVVVTLQGDLDDGAFERVRHVVSDLLDDEGHLRVSVEFADGHGNRPLDSEPTRASLARPVATVTAR